MLQTNPSPSPDLRPADIGGLEPAPRHPAGVSVEEPVSRPVLAREAAPARVRHSRLFRIPFGNGVRVNFPVIFAPMAGLSHLAFRQLVRTYLPANAETLLFTEMLSTRLLPGEEVGRTPKTRVAAGERDLIPQLLGNDECWIAPSLTKLMTLSPAGIDINMGCPVSKVLKHNWGVALMGDIRYAEEVVRTTRRLTSLPLSVKMRTGLKDDPEYLVDFARMLEQAGADWVTLHPRIQSQHRRGQANWEYIGRVRDAVRIPVIGNGDVQQASDIVRMLQQTGCDGVMVARAATARPWIFWQVAEQLGFDHPSGREEQRAPRTAEEEGREYQRALSFFCDRLEAGFTPAEQLPRLRLFLAWGHKWVFFGHYLSTRVNRCRDLKSARGVIDDFFETPKPMKGRTRLQ